MLRQKGVIGVLPFRRLQEFFVWSWHFILFNVFWFRIVIGSCHGIAYCNQLKMAPMMVMMP
jgi:hypothetical protein